MLLTGVDRNSIPADSLGVQLHTSDVSKNERMVGLVEQVQDFPVFAGWILYVVNILSTRVKRTKPSILEPTVRFPWLFVVKQASTAIIESGSTIKQGDKHKIR